MDASSEKLMAKKKAPFTAFAFQLSSRVPLMLIILFSLLVRWCVSLHPYSGEKTPPMFGDYEAQRHWQEIALHLPISQWYVNTTQNDLQYWGLDYPPLTAYHSLLMGYVADVLDPESVRLFASRGFESEDHKLFMRSTVFSSDVYFFISAVLLYSYINFNAMLHDLIVRREKMTNVFFLPEVFAALCLLYPGLILIDHGHFQYNCVSLGLFLWATVYVLLQKNLLSSIFFVMALNYKQMELYHALPFFFYMLRFCATRNRFIAKITHLTIIAIVVIGTFAAIWLPFLKSMDSVTQVLQRLFPMARGVFEDKVANVWCAINIFIKLKNVFSNAAMMKLCAACTLVASAPSCADLLFRGNIKKFKLSLINVSLAFFLFSYQVHEKTILLCSMPVLLYLPNDPLPCLWFLIISNFSMIPLLIKDNLMIALVGTTILYITIFILCIKIFHNNASLETIFNMNQFNNFVLRKSEAPRNWCESLYTITFSLSMIGMAILWIRSVFFKPPEKYPDLYPLLVSVYSCGHFVLFYLYFNLKQLRSES